MEPLGRAKGRLEELRVKVAYDERVKQVMNHIHAARDVDQLLITLHDEILSLFDAERLALYAVDYDKKEVYSRFSDLDKIREIRVPLNDQSIVGFVARNCLKVNIANAYDKAELARVSPTLAFDSSWDQKSGLRTEQVLTVPVFASDKMLTGVIQLVNKKSADRFTHEDEGKVQEIAQALGIALQNQYQLAKKKPAKFDALVARNLLSQTELEAAMVEAREKQRSLESILTGTYRISKKDIGYALGTFYQCPFFEPGDSLVLAPELAQSISPTYLKANFWVPLRRTNGTIEILTDDPFDYQKKQDIRRLFPGREIKFVVGLQDDVLKVVNAVSADLAATASGEALVTLLGQLAAEPHEKKEAATDGVVDENDSVIVRLVNQMITDAYKAGASDIHIEPYGENTETIVRFRVDGNCYETLRIPSRYRRAVASRLKVIANLDIAERRKPQDGKIKFRLPDRDIELRVATVPTAGTDNEDVVLRILTGRTSMPLDKLNMSERNLQQFSRLLEKPYGLILCVGPTGSGKTTTLHAALKHLNAPHRKIWTAEDPVEITQPGLRQVQMHTRIGLDFATALRAFLRADPDIIMVGEIRDRETADTGIEASLTGHLVFSTLHTNSAAESVVRLLEMGLDPFNFADALLGILAQRLARTICQACREPYRPSKEEYDALAYGYGEEAFATLGIRYDERFRLFRGKGCLTCRQSGYKGRIGLHELLVATDETKSLIHARAPVAELLRVAIAQGMTTLVQDGIMKTLQGWTDYNQIKAVAMR